MKATDLMIGDWVKCTDPRCEGHQVDLIDHGNEEVGLDGEIDNFENIIPIPITPEILEENGLWEKDPDRNPNCLIAEANTTTFNDSEGKPHSWVHIQDISSIECMRWYIKIWGKGNLVTSGYIGYVHELQHALRLCGIDKEITL